MTARPLPPGHIRAAFAPITPLRPCTCDMVGEAHLHSTRVATVTDRTDAPDAEFEARLERLDRLEVADEDTVERVARAIANQDSATHGVTWADLDKYERGIYRDLASTAVAALKPS